MSRKHIVLQILGGTTVYRALFHREVGRNCAHVRGSVVDIAGDTHGEYRAYLPSGIDLKTFNIAGADVDIPGDFNRPLPFADGSVDHVLFFNAIYIAHNPESLFREVRRILKPGGTLCLASPFVSNEMRSPHDFLRYTSEGLSRLAGSSGFKVRTIRPFGERFSSAAYLLNPLWLVSPVRAFVYSLALLLDGALSKKMKDAHPAPLGYFCVFTV